MDIPESPGAPCGTEGDRERRRRGVAEQYKKEATEQLAGGKVGHDGTEPEDKRVRREEEHW